MPTPKEFVNQAIAMETFFEDEEPTYDEFMRYPPFDSLMKEEFSLQKCPKLALLGIFIKLERGFVQPTPSSPMKVF